MGCYNSIPEYEKVPSLHDRSVQEEERNLGLYKLHIHKFRDTLMSINQLQEVTVEELGNAFNSINFGAQLKEEKDDTVAKLLVSAKIFQGLNYLDKLSLLSIGLLYTEGSTEDKINVIMAAYDNRKYKIIYTDDLKKVITQIVTIACLAMPSIVLRYEIDQSKVNRIVSNSIVQIFGGNNHVNTKQLDLAVVEKVSYIFNPAKLRMKLHVKEEIDKMHKKKLKREQRELMQ